MAVYSFDGSSSVTTPAFNAAVDIVAFSVAPERVANFTQSGANVVVTLKTGQTLTLTGTTLAALAPANFAISGGGQILIGDQSNQTVADQFGNTIEVANVGTNTANDIVLGLGGNDTINVGGGNNLVFGGSGAVDPTDGNDSITAGTGNDTLVGNGGNDTINAGGGSDLVYGGAGSDVINVGAGFDPGVTAGTTAAGQTASIFGGGSGVDPNDTADTILGGINNGTLTLFGNGGADTLSIAAGSGNQTIYGGVGADTINVGTAGLTGADSVTGNTVIYGGEDGDTISIRQTATANTTIYGGISGSDSVDGADSITVNGGRSTIFANAGNDTVTATNVVNTTIYAGIGNDTVDVTVANAAGNSAVIYGGAGTDTLTVNVGAQASAVVYGGDGISSPTDGNDTITSAGAGSVVIYANAGDDRIVLNGTGNEVVYAGNGNDVIVLDNATNVGTKLLADFNVAGGGTDTLLLGTGEAAQLALPAGSISTAGTTLNLTNGATGATALNVSIANVGNTVFTARIDSSTGTATTTGLVDANDGAFIVNTTTTAQSLAGTGAADFIYGGSGVDTITDGAGADRIVGNGGNDVINLVNDGAADTIVFSSTAAANGVDSIAGFTAGAGGDIFDFSSFIGATPTALNAVVTSNPGGATTVENDVNRLVDIAGGQDISTAAGLKTALAAGGEYANIDMAANSKAIFITAADSNAGTQSIFYATSDGAGEITVTLVGTASNVDIDAFANGNFGI